MIGWRKWLRRPLRALAVAYPVTLLLLVIVLRGYGETAWVRALLYVPRVLFAVPLPFLALALALARDWRFLAAQGAALLLLLFPLMGLVLPWPHGADGSAPVLRVMSYNVNSGYWGWDKVMAQVDELHPDVVLFQEVFSDSRWPVQMLKQRYPEAQASTQFIVASRFPIRQVIDSEKVNQDGRQRSPRSISYLIDTPLGPIAFYNVHPVSPRQGMWHLRWGFGKAIRSGTLFDPERSERMDTDGHLLDLQVQMFAARAGKETVPVIIGGDTNMTGLTPTLRSLDGFTDGFRQAGWGFGYTYPAGRKAWMRLDRIFASPALRFVGFQVGKHAWASDHLCVVADLQRRNP